VVVEARAADTGAVVTVAEVVADAAAMAEVVAAGAAAADVAETAVTAEVMAVEGGETASRAFELND
jgi:hypothetical protein